MRKLIIILALMAAPTATAQEWPNWRGPSRNGVAEAGAYPTEWSVDDDLNIAWTAKLPGRGSSTPVVASRRIFLTCNDRDSNAVVCLDEKGERKWITSVGLYKDGKHKKASGANPSPTTDGEHVYVYFKSGDLACLDFKGHVVWETNLQERFAEDNLWWDLGTSPVLVDNIVIVACMQTGDSYLAAFDKATGELAWKVDRNLPSPVESNQSYTTPCLVQTDAGWLLAVVGADHITGHQVTDGKELWRVGDLNPEQHKMFRSISSPVNSSDMVFFCYARGESLTAVRVDPESEDERVAWSLEGKFADVPTPALDGDRLYLCTDKGTVLCLSAQDGETVWEKKLKKFRGGVSASPILVGNLLYQTTEDGKTFVLDVEQDGAIVGQGDVGDLVVATPIFVDNKILVRTPEKLICIAE